ncbi:response regulator [Chitinophagaceae bacterium MMS25-I14]
MTTIANSSSITRRLQLVFTLSVGLLLLSTYALFYSMQNLIENSKLVNHTNTILIESENIISFAKDAETGQRGYLLTHDPIFLDPYRGSYQKVMASLHNVKELTTDNPVQQQRIQTAQSLINRRFAQLRQVIDTDAANNITGEELRFILNANKSELLRGKMLMDSLRLVVNNIQSDEKKLLAERTAGLTKYINYTPYITLIAALISIAITIAAYLRIKADLDQRIAQQREAEAKYIETAERIASMEHVTKEISNGDYSIRSTDKGDDDLGRISKGLNEMAASLQSNFNLIEHRSWLQEGTVATGNALRGKLDVKELSSDVLEVLAPYCNATAATFYTTGNNMQLELSASYAVTHAPEYIDPAHGLIGQALKKRGIFYIDDLPADYLPIQSSLGKTNPVSVVIVPLRFNDELLGAIEMAFLHKPEEKIPELLQNIMESISIGLNAVFNYKQLQDLFEQTQAQTEELQAQHSELEHLNTELEIQTQKLQASDEELRVQQEELQQTNQELEERTRLLEERNQLIIERNLEVQKKAEELALSTKYKSEFLANMSHELRTPLNSILLLSRLMAENNEHNLSPDQVSYAQVIQSSGNGLLSLIDEILDLSKIEAGKMQLEYGYTPVSEITGTMQSLFGPVAKEKGLELKIQIARDVPEHIETDRMRLEQILKNLFSNAIKFTAHGSVTLEIQKAAGNNIVFAVKDTGIGISKEKQKIIFEAFQQADGSTRRKYGGTGLGLSISRELSRLLGGEIVLESEENKGSTFTLYLPAAKPEAKDVVAEPQEMPQSLLTEPQQDITKNTNEKYISDTIPESIPDDRQNISGDEKTILIVEDDTNFARSLLEFTRNRGYKGIVAVRGDEAVSLAAQHLPVGILLDIQLPVKSGWEVMEELKQNKRTRHIPVHIMSSHEVKNESLQKGAINFINKPVAFEQMQDIFKKLEYVLNHNTKKVLIVEDNPKHAKALAYFLESFNVNSEIKSNVDDGVSSLQKKEVDCVILDMGIPDQNAYDLLETVKQNPGLENLPIIIFTGKSLSRKEEQRIRQYADSIVVKTAHSYHRILDEVSLFLHLVEEQKPSAGNGKIKKLGNLADVLNGKTVLIADDDVRNIFSLTKTLESLNMKVLTAVDGREALQQLESHPSVDIVLMDMMMPEMDGYESTARIRSNPQWKNLPVIAVTAKAMTGDRQKCIKAGASDYITKPVDTDQLLSLLRVWLYEKA